MVNLENFRFFQKFSKNFFGHFLVLKNFQKKKINFWSLFSVKKISKIFGHFLVLKNFREFFVKKQKKLKLKSDHNCFQNFSQKSTIFQIYHLTFSKNIFFEVTNFFENFFGEN